MFLEIHNGFASFINNGFCLCYQDKTETNLYFVNWPLHFFLITLKILHFNLLWPVVKKTNKKTIICKIIVVWTQRKGQKSSTKWRPFSKLLFGWWSILYLCLNRSSFAKDNKLRDHLTPNSDLPMALIRGKIIQI